jgi:hypothetical protein
MNILQRKMFAQGDVANKSVSEPLIRYYVSQGYNPAEIKAAYPAAPYGLIEQIAIEFGGLVNPGVQGRNSTGYTADMPQAVTEGQFGNLLNQVPMNETIVTGSPTGNLQPVQASPPSMPNPANIMVPSTNPQIDIMDMDPIIQGNRMGIPTPDLAGNIDPSLSNDLLNQKIQNLIAKRNSLIAELGFPSGEIPEVQMLDQEIESLKAQLPSNATAPSLDQQIADLSSVPEVNTTVDIETGLPTEKEIAGETSKKSFYVDSKGVEHSMSPDNFKEYINGLSPKDIQAMFQAPNIVFSQDLKNILATRAAQVKTPASNFNPDPNMIGKPQLNSPITPGTALKEYGGVLKDVGIETAEELYNLGRRGLGVFDYLFGSQEEYENKGPFEKVDFKTGRFKELDDPTNPYPNSPGGSAETMYDTLKDPGNQKRFRASSIDAGGQARFGYTANELDNMILNSKIDDPIQNSINDANKTDAAVIDADKKSDEVITDENATEAEEKATEGLDFSKYAPDLQERLDAELSDTSRITGQPTEQEQENINRVITNQGSFFSSPDWNEFLRNLGIGLSESPDMASGLVRGTALGSQAKALREAEALEAEQEERLELIKAGAEDSLKPTDVVSLNKMTSELSTNIKDFEGSRASIGIMNDAISLFEEAVANKVEVTGLQGKISRFTDQGKAFFNIDGEVSDSTKIQNYIDQVKQRSIREILNESGRTISNLDRDIVDRVFGELNLTDNPQETLKKLKNARNSLLDSNLDKQRVIGTNYSSITNKAYGATGLRTIAPYEVMVQQILNANPSSFGTMQPIQGAVNVDLRGQNIFGNN